MKPADRLRTVEAVIISHRDFGEADRMITLFSKEAGKIRGLAKGVRKMGSRKAAYLEPFMHSKVALARGKIFWIITQADGIKQYTKISESLEKTGMTAYVMELVERFTIEEEPSRQLFQLIVNTLLHIDSREEIFNPMLYFELRILDYTGFRPDLIDCVGCGTKISAQDQYFSAEQGGVICPQCGVVNQNLRKVSMDALRFLRHFQRNSYAALADVNVPEQVRKEIVHLMNGYLSSIIERRLNAPEFMRQVKRNVN